MLETMFFTYTMYTYMGLLFIAICVVSVFWKGDE
jgi:hypothetical protein